MMHRVVLLSAALLGASAAGATAPEPKDEVPIPLIPGGVANPDGKSGYVANPDGRVVALHLETGKPLWASKTVGRPLAYVADARAAPAPELKPAEGFLPLPVGVADADGRTGFFADADGGVIACDLETGNILWQHGDGGRPVALAGGRVLVQTRDPKKDHVLRIIALDADKGDQALESEPIILPDWSTNREGDWGAQSFHSSTRLYKGDLWLIWQADAGYWGGPPPSPEIEKAAEKHAGGAARIHLDSGKVEMLKAAPPPPAVKISRSLWDKAARQYPTPRRVTEARVVTAGDYAVAVDTEQQTPTTVKVTLRRWDLATEKELDPIVLAPDGPYQTLPLPSAGLVLLRKGLSRDAPQARADWTAYALETGKEVGRVPFEGDAAEVTVIGPRAYTLVRGSLEPGGPYGAGLWRRTLLVTELKTGARLWKRLVEGEVEPPPPPP